MLCKYRTPPWNYMVLVVELYFPLCPTCLTLAFVMRVIVYHLSLKIGPLKSELKEKSSKEKRLPFNTYLSCMDIWKGKELSRIFGFLTAIVPGAGIPLNWIPTWVLWNAVTVKMEICCLWTPWRLRLVSGVVINVSINNHLNLSKITWGIVMKACLIPMEIPWLLLDMRKCYRSSVRGCIQIII